MLCFVRIRITRSILVGIGIAVFRHIVIIGLIGASGIFGRIGLTECEIVICRVIFTFFSHCNDSRPLAVVKINGNDTAAFPLRFSNAARILSSTRIILSLNPV